MRRASEWAFPLERFATLLVALTYVDDGLNELLNFDGQQDLLQRAESALALNPPSALLYLLVSALTQLGMGAVLALAALLRPHTLSPLAASGRSGPRQAAVALLLLVAASTLLYGAAPSLHAAGAADFALRNSGLAGALLLVAANTLRAGLTRRALRLVGRLQLAARCLQGVPSSDLQGGDALEGFGVLAVPLSLVVAAGWRTRPAAGGLALLLVAEGVRHGSRQHAAFADQLAAISAGGPSSVRARLYEDMSVVGGLLLLGSSAPEPAELGVDECLEAGRRRAEGEADEMGGGDAPLAPRRASDEQPLLGEKL